MTDTFTSRPVSPSPLSPLCSLPCLLRSALLDEDGSEPDDVLEAVLGNEGEDGDEEALGIDGIDGDEDDDDEGLGNDGIEFDGEEDEELGSDGIDGDELGLDEGDDGLGIEGIELLELELEDGVWQAASISVNAEAVISVPNLGCFAMLMGQSSSPVFGDPCKKPVRTYISVSLPLCQGPTPAGSVRRRLDTQTSGIRDHRSLARTGPDIL